MASVDKLEELNLTQDEIKRFTEALQKPEFKELLYEYAQEISDPANRARYEMEIRQLENERGMDVKFINPEPGYVIKTTVSGDRKAFINVCKNELIGKPSSTKKIGVDGRPGLCWSLPHSFTPPREDVSKSGVKCTVFDFVVHPDTYRMAETNPRFKSMVNDTALEGIKKMFDVEVDFKNLRFPKIKYKGNPTSTVIRDKLQESTAAADPDDDLSSRFAYPYDNKTTEEKSKEIMERNEKAQALKAAKEKKEKNKQPTENEFTIPKYVIKYQSDLDIQDFLNTTDARNATLPKKLIIEVDLPLLQSANPITLDVFEKRLSLVSHQPAKYKLDISLAYPVDENEGSAKFDKNRRKLIVTLPVVPSKNMLEMPFDGKSFKDDSDQAEVEDGKIDGESNGVGLMCKTEQVRPLIEVISEKESEPAVEYSHTITNGEQATVASANSLHHEYGNLVHNVVYLLPDFECQQDDSSLLFTFGTKKVRKESLLSNVLSDNAISVKMTSVGSGGFPVYYSCCLKFDNDCCIDVNNCQLNFSEKESVSLLITKHRGSNGWWKSYSVGVDMAQLEERGLETMTRVFPSDSGEASFQTSLSSNNVIELDANEVLDTDPDTASESFKREGISTEMEVAVVHDDQSSPELHGILKQHSASESSDSSDSASTIHGQNSGTTSGIEAENVDGGVMGASSSSSVLKKSVSFSEQVDVFLENQATLKSQERNVRKCKKRKKLKKQEQRKSNGCSCVDGGDDQSDGQSRGDLSQVTKNKTTSDGAALVASKSVETDTEVGRGDSHINVNNSAVLSVANNVAKNSEGNVRNNISSADETNEDTDGKEICYESVEKGESPDCKTSEEEGGFFEVSQENKENKSLTSDDCSVSQLNASTENSSVADQQQHSDDLKPASAIPILCEKQKSSSDSVNNEKKTNLMVEIKNKFVFDLDVD